MSNDNRRNTLWITMMQAGLLGVVAGLCGYLLLDDRSVRRLRAQQGPTAGRRASQGSAAVRAWRISGAGASRSSRSSTRTATSVSTLRSARPRASRSPPSRRGGGFGRRGGGPGGFGRGGMAPGSAGTQGDARRRQVLSRRRRRSTTSARCGRSSCSSRTPTGSRSSPTSTTPTSRCPRR